MVPMCTYICVCITVLSYRIIHHLNFGRLTTFVTRYEKRDRSGYFIIFAFLVSFDSYACVRSNGAN